MTSLLGLQLVYSSTCLKANIEQEPSLMLYEGAHRLQNSCHTSVLN